MGAGQAGAGGMACCDYAEAAVSASGSAKTMAAMFTGLALVLSHLPGKEQPLAPPSGEGCRGGSFVTHLL